MTSAHYDPRWPHVTCRHKPDEADCWRFYRFVRREYRWDADWRCTVRDVRYNPEDRLAAVFEYAPREAA